MADASDPVPPPGGAKGTKEASNATGTTQTRASGAQETEPSSEARNQSPAQIRAKGSERKSRNFRNSYDDLNPGPLPQKGHARTSYTSNRDRDSGYYGGNTTSQYPWNTGNPYSYSGYPAYGGPGHGQLVPAPPYATPGGNSQYPTDPPHRFIPAGPPRRYLPAIPHVDSFKSDRPGTTAEPGALIVRRTTLPRSNERKRPGGGNAESSTTALNDIDAVWNVSSTRDLTLHLELDVEDDIEANLGEFVRFARRGDYIKAEQYYRDNLARHSEQPKVIVEYVRMLLERGSYSAIQDLGIDEDELEDICRDDDETPHAFEAAHLLLLLHMARTLSDPDFHASYGALLTVRQFLQDYWEELHNEDTDDAEMDEEKEEPQPLSLAEIQLLSLYVHLVKVIEVQSNLDIEPDSQAVAYFLSNRLRITYQNMLAENDHWGIRVAILTHVYVWDSLDLLEELFPETSIADAFSHLLADWQSMEADDELGDLAMLDILCCIDGESNRRFSSRRLSEKPEGGDSDWQIASHLARSVATAIKDNSPQLMKSRPYLNWLIGEEHEYSRGKHLTPDALASFPGEVLYLPDTFVYVPVKSENPGWPVPPSYRSNSAEEDKGASESSLQLLLTARKTAQELGDFNTEAECLVKLICRSAKPERYLAELERLHISVKGSQLSLLKTRLMRYLTVAANSDEQTRRMLKSQLLELDPRLQSIWRNFSHPLWEWAYRRVLYALMCSLGEGDTEQAMAVNEQGQAMLSSLPSWIQNATSTAAGAQPHTACTSPTYSDLIRGDDMLNINKPKPRAARQKNDNQELSERVTRMSPAEDILMEKQRQEHHPKIDPPNQISNSAPPPPPPLQHEDPENTKNKEDSNLQKQLKDVEEERRKQNEIIKKRAEEEKQKQHDRRIRRETREHMQRMFDEKQRLAEQIRIEREKARDLAVLEARERLLREEEELRLRRRDDEQLRLRITAEVRDMMELERRAREAAVEEKDRTVQVIRAEAKKEFELEQRAKEEAAAARRKAKKEQASREAEIFLKGQAKMLRELEAGVPRRKSRAILGPGVSVSASDSEDLEPVDDTGRQRRLIGGVDRDVSDSDTGSSVVDNKARQGRKYMERGRRCSSSCSSCDRDGLYSLEEGRLDSEKTRRVIAERYRISPGGSRCPIYSDDEPIVEGEVEVTGEGEAEMAEDKSHQDDGGEVPSDSSKPEEKGKGKDLANEEYPEVGSAKLKTKVEEPEEPLPTTTSEPSPGLDEKPAPSIVQTSSFDSLKRAKVSDESEEELEEQGTGECGAGTVKEGKQPSVEDLGVPEGVVPDSAVDEDTVLDVYE